ncbi:aminoacylase [Shimia abyssi]|uniref:N-acyl-D-aspartate/D-glutamate deacylase n=1 Tax=Shimia abyssi TaxID=1662395 RepID=A0A2P8F6D9_9RHOB|nr:aminoacylase [Shimia abyssi]PSL17281.1 N-acyl-D-aspartate/D-glutamate deacylase [Shimia abyssi]
MPKLKPLGSASYAMVVFLCGGSSLFAQTYDVAIMNGRVMDPETGYDQVANVGISDGWIVKITTDPIEGTDVIDATDHVVAPGFIDSHTHSSQKYALNMSMMDGVTSAYDGEVGAVHIADWYAREEGKWSINYGTCVSHELARMVVLDGLTIDQPSDATEVFDLRALASAEDGVADWSVTRANIEQLNQIMAIIDKGLQEGALCAGSTVGYAGTGISTYEQFELQRTAARYGRATGVHGRFHTSSQNPEAPLGFDEVFTNAYLLDAPLLYSHNNDYGWWEIEEKLQLARAKGLNMWSEYYPYTAGSTSIASDQLKPEAIGALGLEYKDIMYDPSEDKFLTDEEYASISADDPGRAVIVFNPAREEWLPQWLRVPHMVVASDSMWHSEDLGADGDHTEFAGHPRTSGSHSTVLKLARDNDVELMFTLSQLSYWPALHMGGTGVKFLDVRGRMQEGMAADIVIFDPETVAPGSDYKAKMQGTPPIGIPHVIVNGVFTKRDNEPTGELPGQPMRFPVEDAPRQVKVDTQVWLNTFTLQDGALDGVGPSFGKGD